MKKILLIDDERSIRRTFKFFLEKEGFYVVASEDAIQALEILQNKKFDLIITDCIMPKMNGLDLVNKLQMDNIHIPVIVMTGEPSAENQAAAFKENAMKYLLKPISKDILINSVKSIL